MALAAREGKPFKRGSMTAAIKAVLVLVFATAILDTHAQLLGDTCVTDLDCFDFCIGGICTLVAATPPSSLEDGTPCTSSYDCEKYCVGGFCGLPRPATVSDGSICFTPTDCINFCNSADTLSPLAIGICGPVATNIPFPPSVPLLRTPPPPLLPLQTPPAPVFTPAPVPTAIVPTTAPTVTGLPPGAPCTDSLQCLDYCTLPDFVCGMAAPGTVLDGDFCLFDLECINFCDTTTNTCYSIV